MLDLSEVLSGETVSKLDTSRDQIEYIDIDIIDGDPTNFYSLKGLEDLAANIQVCGLQQPIRVRGGENGHVIIVSGHRRRAALQLLVGEGLEQYRAVPCIRERQEGSPALQELRLIYANSDTRELTISEISKQAERVEMLLYQLKEEGMEFPGRMRDHVAQACRVSAPKLARLKVIREKLISEYITLFDKDKLPEQTAYNLARLPSEFQKRLANVLSEPPSGRTAEKLLDKYNAGWRWEPKLACPDGKECRRGDTFLRRDCEVSSWKAMCGGNTCCLECREAKSSCYPCDRMCSKAKAQRKNAKCEAEAAENRKKQRQGRKYQEETQKYAKRLLRAIEAAGLSDNEQIPWEYYEKHPVAVIRKWAAGDFDEPAKWHYAKLVPGKCNDLLEAAKLLECSTDFLMGLTDELRPTAAPSEEIAQAVDSSMQNGPEPVEEDASEVTEDGEHKAQVKRIRWESRGRTPPEHVPILTWNMTNAGAVWRAAQWDGSHLVDPGNPQKELTGLEYRRWLEIPPADKEYEYAPTALWGWWPDKPSEAGLYWCVRGPMSGGGGLYWWDPAASQWEHPGVAGVVLTPEVALWMKCPELPESMRWERLELNESPNE